MKSYPLNLPPRQQQGFTLIELIMVIVILGILAAVAVPKFADISTDARTASVKSLEGSMRSANTFIYAKTASNPLGLSVSTVQINGGPVGVAFGYASDATELAKVMELNTADFTVSGNDIQMSSAPTPSSCSVTYGPSTGTGVSPTYTQVITGC